MAFITGIDHIGIGAVLAAQNLRVPIYQRPFSWQQDQVSDLLNDVSASIQKAEDEYFLGSIVLTTEGDKRRPVVVDGQQRLAAVSMIFAAIRDYFVNRGDVERAAQIETQFLFTRDLRTQTIEPKLRLNLEDSEFFESHVLERPGSQRRVSAVPRSSSTLRISQAFSRIAERITKEAEASSDSVDVLVEWTDCLWSRVKTIVVTVSSEANAFQIFETLNDRGLDLSIADLLKNYVFGQAGDEKLALVQSEWQRAMTIIGADSGPEALTTFLRHFWASKHGLTRERQLYQSIKNNIRNSRAAADFSVELGQAAHHYSAMLNSDHEFWLSYGTRTKRNIQTLLMLRMEQYRPLLLACMSQMPQAEVQAIIEMLVSWSVRFRIAHKLGSSSLEHFFGNAGMLVRSGEIGDARALSKHASNTVPNDKEFVAAFATAQVTQNNLARYYLRSLEKQASGNREQEVVADEQQVNLEHILPQRAKRDEWIEFDDETISANVYRLGNMTLLLARENAKIGNKPFEVKRVVFLQSSLLTTKDVAEFQAWTPDAIDKRQLSLAELAAKAWPAR